MDAVIPTNKVTLATTTRPLNTKAMKTIPTPALPLNPPKGPRDIFAHRGTPWRSSTRRPWAAGWICSAWGLCGPTARWAEQGCFLPFCFHACQIHQDEKYYVSAAMPFPHLECSYPHKNFKHRSEVTSKTLYTKETQSLYMPFFKHNTVPSPLIRECVIFIYGLNNIL